MRQLVALIFLLSGYAGAEVGLNYERALDDGPSFSAYLVSYRSSGLKVYAMIAVPNGEVPDDGYPVVIANHGYVPDPRKYGITAKGVDSRPGDYYRSVPELYASRGFIVILPDYRGHNSSEGYEQIKDQNREAVGLYANDVLALMVLLGEVKDADPANVFMWSHSMGGNVSMIVLLTTDLVRASSFWATGGVDEHFADLDRLNGPVMIQHAKGDGSTAHSDSANLASALQAIDHPHVFHSYDSADHFFTGEIREIAADRDVEFFRAALGKF